ncbi:MAG: PmbA/TldA family metallopeptidase, partial [Bacillota bacterium]
MVKNNDGVSRGSAPAGAESDRVLGLLEKVLSWVEADQAEVIWQSGEDYLTRYANNVIHQNVAERSGEARLRAVLGHKVGQASTRDLSEEGLRAAAREAVAIARLQPDNPEFKSLVSAADVAAMPATGRDRSLPASAFASPRTVAFTPEERADAVRAVTERAKKRGLESAGAYRTSFTQLAVANSLGVRAFTQLSDATLTAVVMSGTGSGYVDAHSRDASRIDPAAVAEEAVEKCLANRGPVGIDAGEYEVIFEEYAV